MRHARTALVLLLALCAAPAELAVAPAAADRTPAPVWVALSAAAAASRDQLAGALAEAPGRAHLVLHRAAAAALAGCLPEASLASARALLDEITAWRARAALLAGAAGSLRAFSTAAGGPAAALDRALDAAALAAAAVFAWRLALRPRRPCPGTRGGRPAP